jgi:hypothetical protein
MSTITAILEPDPDGTLHLPVPAEWREGKLKVTAVIEAVSDISEQTAREAAVAALKRLRARGTFRDITDAAAWQREIRRDRPLPGREE